MNKKTRTVALFIVLSMAAAIPSRRGVRPKGGGCVFEKQFR